MDMILNWILKEYRFIVEGLPKYLGYYNMRDRIPFFSLLSYLFSKNNNNWFAELCTKYFFSGLCAMGLLSTYYFILDYPNDRLTGFKWSYMAPIQYLLQIAIIFYIGLKTTKNKPYSYALGFNGAAATGYLYEMPYWIFSIKREQAHFIHTNYNYVFYIDFQILAIFVYLWLLKEQKIDFKHKDLIGFIIVFSYSILMASQMYVFNQNIIARIPMIIYFIYLSSKLYSTKGVIKCL